MGYRVSLDLDSAGNPEHVTVWRTWGGMFPERRLISEYPVTDPFATAEEVYNGACHVIGLWQWAHEGDGPLPPVGAAL